MDDFIYFILIGFLVILVIYLLSKKENVGVESLKEELKEIQDEIRESREKSFESLQGQLVESNRIVKNVTSELEKIHSDHKNVIDVKDQIGKLNDVLSNPKQRGILGEYFLESLLKNVFQPHQYKCQYSFKDGEIVDAVIFIKDKIIPIDAKFSLRNYNRILDEGNDLKRENLEKSFKKDLKFRIEETSKYIRPNEGTMDFAFMFIPSEGIYYDLLINRVGGMRSNTSDLIEYAFKEKHVIIVSPTSFYAYLQTVLQGLRALRIEESAKNVITNVESLQKSLLNYESFLRKLGDNLSTTVNAYNRSYKEFSRIDKDIVKITKKKDKVKSLKIEKPNHRE